MSNFVKVNAWVSGILQIKTSQHQQSFQFYKMSYLFFFCNLFFFFAMSNTDYRPDYRPDILPRHKIIILHEISFRSRFFFHLLLCHYMGIIGKSNRARKIQINKKIFHWMTKLYWNRFNWLERPLNEFI